MGLRFSACFHALFRLSSGILLGGGCLWWVCLGGPWLQRMRASPALSIRGCRRVASSNEASDPLSPQFPLELDSIYNTHTIAGRRSCQCCRRTRVRPLPRRGALSGWGTQGLRDSLRSGPLTAIQGSPSDSCANTDQTNCRRPQKGVGVGGGRRWEEAEAEVAIW